MTLRLIIPGDPAPWQVYTRQGPPPLGVLKFQAWQEQIRVHLRQAWGKKEPLSGPVVLDLEFYLPWADMAPKRNPQSIETWYWKHLAMKPDKDNLQKAFSDACGAKPAVYGRNGRLIRDAEPGILFHGDQQVVRGETRKDILRPTVYVECKEGYTVMRFRPLEKP